MRYESYLGSEALSIKTGLYLIPLDLLDLDGKKVAFFSTAMPRSKFARFDRVVLRLPFCEKHIWKTVDKLIIQIDLKAPPACCLNTMALNASFSHTNSQGLVAGYCDG